MNPLPEVRNWDQWREVFDDLTIWSELALEVCQIHGVRTGGRLKSTFPGTCAVINADDRVIVKIFPPFLVSDYRVEVELLRLCSTIVDLEVPQLVAHGVKRGLQDWPYILLTYCHGRTVREIWSEISREGREYILRQLASTMRQIHLVPISESQLFENPKAKWHSFLRARMQESVKELEELCHFSDQLICEVESFISNCTLDNHWDERIRLLNGDVTEDHVILVYRHGEWRLSCLIDWADALVGCEEYEWVALWFGLLRRDAELFTSFINSYDPTVQINQGFTRKMLFFTLIHQFGPKIISELLKEPNAPPISSLAELREWLWPFYSKRSL